MFISSGYSAQTRSRSPALACASATRDHALAADVLVGRRHGPRRRGPEAGGCNLRAQLRGGQPRELDVIVLAGDYRSRAETAAPHGALALDHDRVLGDGDARGRADEAKAFDGCPLRRGRELTVFGVERLGVGED